MIDANLYIFGFPTHIGGPPRKSKGLLRKIKINQKESGYSLMTTCIEESTRVPAKLNRILDGK